MSENTVYKPKVLFVLPNLEAGGAERIISFVAQNISTENFESHLLIIGHASKSVYNIDNVETTFLHKKRVLSGIPSIIFFLLKFKPNIVVSSIGHLNTVLGILAPFFSNCKFIIREASVASIMGTFSQANKIYAILAKIAYRNIDAVICQSHDMANDFIHLHKIPIDKIFVINNPITEIFALKENSISNNLQKYITIGRLSKEKGHIRLLEILANIDYPFKYTILGSGPEKETIFKRIAELGLSEKVTHIPFTNKVGEELRKNDAFLQGSFVEGFPNAVLESCVVGIPVLAFNAPGGTNEIIDEGINGFIVSNKDEFIFKLKCISETNWNPKKIRDSVSTKFNKKKIISQYEDLMIDLIKS